MSLDINIDTPPRISESFNQVAHGFVVGDWIRVSSANTFTKAQATSFAPVVGVVTAVADANNFTVTMRGYITTGVPVAPAGTVCYLSESTAGAPTDTPPVLREIPLMVIIESGAKAFVVVDVDSLRMKQQLPSAVFATVPASVTRYGYLFGYSGTLQATENQRQSISFAGRYYYWRLRTLSVQSATGSLTFTARNNGANSSLQIVIPAGGAAAEYQDFTNLIQAGDGDLLSYSAINAASVTSTTITMFNLIYRQT